MESEDISAEAPPVKCGKCWNMLMKRHRAFITTRCIVITLFIIGLLFLGLGATFIIITNNMFEQEINYDQECIEQIENNNFTSNNCIVTFNVTETLKGKIILLYHLSNFYQNHRRIFQSKSDKQIKGSYLTYNQLSACSPKISIDDSKDPKKLYLPCGLAPLSFMNDTYHFVDPQIDSKFSEKGISLKQERDKLYKPLSSSYTEGYRWLEEITPEGTTDEHFIVWMRTAAMPNFIKVFSICTDCRLEPGNYQLQITMNYPQSMYEGGRSVILATTSVLGSRSYFISVTYLSIGGLSLLFSLGCLFQLFWCPRKFGDVDRIFPIENPETHTVDQRLSESNLPRRQSSRQQIHPDDNDLNQNINIPINDIDDNNSAIDNDNNNELLIDTHISSDNDSITNTDQQNNTNASEIISQNSSRLMDPNNNNDQYNNHDDASHIISETASAVTSNNNNDQYNNHDGTSHIISETASAVTSNNNNDQYNNHDGASHIISETASALASNNNNSNGNGSSLVNDSQANNEGSPLLTSSNANNEQNESIPSNTSQINNIVNPNDNI